MAHKLGKMKAVQWEGKLDSVSVKDVDIPKIQQPLDAIVRITSAGICGTDLHTYHGRIEMNVPLTFGHESLGIVEEIGSAVTTLKKGDRVVVAVADFQADVDDNLTVGGLFGIGQYGTFPQMNGGQAQFMRLPNAEVNVLLLPPGDEHELDYLLLADIWPTAWYALDCAGQVFGDTVVVFGAGASSRLTGIADADVLQALLDCYAPTRRFFAELSGSTASTMSQNVWPARRALVPFL
jgi:threonine dehydrogenase-like Zn-dependent dehydrogenase